MQGAGLLRRCSLGTKIHAQPALPLVTNKSKECVQIKINRPTETEFFINYIRSENGVKLAPSSIFEMKQKEILRVTRLHFNMLEPVRTVVISCRSCRFIPFL